MDHANVFPIFTIRKFFLNRFNCTNYHFFYFITVFFIYNQFFASRIFCFITFFAKITCCTSKLCNIWTSSSTTPSSSKFLVYFLGIFQRNFKLVIFHFFNDTTLRIYFNISRCIIYNLHVPMHLEFQYVYGKAFANASYASTTTSFDNLRRLSIACIAVHKIF